MVLLVPTGTPAAAASAAPLARFEQLRGEDLRVASVAYRISITNRALCGPVLVPQLGFVLHSIEQYGAADRDAAARSFGFGEQVGVMAVVGGSPAERAGLLAGDRLVSVNGRVPQGAGSGDPSRAAVDSAQALLTRELRRGPVTLKVSGTGGERVLRFVAENGCPVLAELIPGGEVNAWADGSRVIISEGLLRRCGTDADLALVIGHELAHNLLHHRQRLAEDRVSTNRLLPSAAGSMAMRETEEEADGLAVRLATTASYDLSGALAFMGGLLNRGVALAATHPASARRLELLGAAIGTQGTRAARAVPFMGKTAPSGLVSGRI